jgi:hypothetical protein
LASLTHAQPRQPDATSSRRIPLVVGYMRDGAHWSDAQLAWSGARHQASRKALSMRVLAMSSPSSRHFA